MLYLIYFYLGQYVLNTDYNMNETFLTRCVNAEDDSEEDNHGESEDKGFHFVLIG